MNCGGCKYYAQGENCSYCEHPKQMDEDLKGYCYYTFSCDLFSKGISQTRIDYMNKLYSENEHWFTKILKRLRLL